MDLLRLNKESGYNYRERRQDDWTENYTLYRDKVTVNRLTQRQSVNLPLMKQQLRTLLNNVDDMPVIEFESLDNDEQKEIFQNKYWEEMVECNKMELLDVVDKRQVLFFGRSFDQIQIIDGKVKMSIIDPEDILVDRFTDPTNIDSSRFLIHTHIFVPLSTLKNNPDYDQDAIAELTGFYGTEQGLIKSATNEQSYIKKNEKMADLGQTDVDNPILGETIVELSMHFVFRDDEVDAEQQKLDPQYFVYVEADDMKLLMKKPLEDVYGVTEDNYWRNHLPYNTWADDIDNQDFWTDGVADMIRTPNKVLNAWFSQIVENRTLKNLNMNVFNSNLEGFTPTTWDPKAWGMYGIPLPQGGKIADAFQQMPVQDLSESLDEINFVKGFTEQASGATSTLQGVQTERKITLGEVELALGEAKDRVKGMSKFYTQVWKERATKFLKLLEANADKLDAVKIYTKGRNSDDLYEREIESKDYAGRYRTKVWSQDEKDTKDTKSLEKLNATRQLFPGNTKFDEIVKRKALEFNDLPPDDINAIMQIEVQNAEMLAAMATNSVPGTAPAADPNPPQMGPPVV